MELPILVYYTAEKRKKHIPNHSVQLDVYYIIKVIIDYTTN